MTSDGGEKAFDPVLFDVTRISAEEIAEQITKDDFQVFRCIQPDEVKFTFTPHMQLCKVRIYAGHQFLLINLCKF